MGSDSVARKNDKAPFRKQEILEHFQQVLIEEGIEGASMAKIAARMGVHPSLFVHYFKTKYEMILGLVDYILEKYEGTFIKKLEEIKNPEERLKAGLETIFGVGWISVVDTRAFNACYYLSLRDTKVRERFQKMYRLFKEYIIREIEVFMDAGIIPRADAGRQADLVIVLVEGLSFYRNISGGVEKYRDLGSVMKELVINMLASPKGTR